MNRHAQAIIPVLFLLVLLANAWIYCQRLMRGPAPVASVPRKPGEIPPVCYIDGKPSWQLPPDLAGSGLKKVNVYVETNGPLGNADGVVLSTPKRPFFTVDTFERP